MHKRGFTLIELLVVIAIIGLLGTFSVVSFKKSVEKARIASAQYFARTIFNRIGENAVAAWNFDECSGSTIYDSSGQGHDSPITYSTTPGWSTDTPLHVGCALNFDGVNDYIDATFSWRIQHNNFTITTWIKTTYNDMGTIISNEDRPILMTTYGGYLGTCIITCQDGTTSFNDGKWHLLILTGDMDSIRLYVDTPNKPYLTMSPSAGVTVGPLTVGHLFYGGINFEGLVDDVRVYQQSMTAQEVHQFYAEEMPKQELAVK